MTRRRTLFLSSVTALACLAFAAAGNLAAQTPVAAAPTATPAPAATPTAATGPAATTAPAGTATTQSFAEAIQQPQTPPDPMEEFIQKTKHPTKWFAWGFDLRVRDEIIENGRKLQDSIPGHEEHFQSFRPRLGFTISPFEDFDINTRVMWQFRNYAEPTDHVPRMDKSQAMLDILNVDWRKVFGLPLELKVGRQEITDLGDGWLVFDGTPLDGSRTIFFDAARATYTAAEAKTTFDLIGISNGTGGDLWMPPSFNDEDKVQLAEQNEAGSIFWVKNRSITNTQLEGYFIYKHDRAELVNGDNGDIYTFGQRDTTDITKNWRYMGEIAEQFGEKDGESLCALGAQTSLTYLFHDAMDNQLHTGYEFLSGDDPGTKKDEGFDILWGRWPQWSELYPYIQINDGRIADYTNLHRFNAIGWMAHPTKAMELVADYNLLWSDENTKRGTAGFSNSGTFRGQLARFIVRYNFTEHIKTHVTGEMFLPGDYYLGPKDDAAFYLRYEVMFVW